MIRSLAALLLVVLVGACGPGERPAVKTGRPERIVSLGPTVTQHLYLLGVEDRLVGNTVYCERPEAAKKKTKIGNVTEVDIEKIVSLSPDLVVAIGLTHPKQVKKLENLGLRVVRFQNPDSFEMLCEEFIKLAGWVGEEDKAGQIVERAEKRVAGIRQKTRDLPRRKVFVQLGDKPLFAATKDSFLNDCVEFAGGENIAREANSGMYSREMVIKQNPDVIVITTMGNAGEEQKKDWHKLRTISAVKNDAIHIVDSYRACSPTVESFADTLEEFVEMIHPGLLEKETQ